jgi:Protein of unknown function (DUF3987)
MSGEPQEPLSDEPELLFRQVNPGFVRDGRVGSQAFRPTPKDHRMLSVARSAVTTAEAAFIHHTECLKLSSAGTWAVTVGECSELGLPVPPSATRRGLCRRQERGSARAKTLRSDRTAEPRSDVRGTCIESRWRTSLATVVEALGALGRSPGPSALGLRVADPNSPFSQANGVDTRLILERYGIEHGEKFAHCPGCGEPGALLCEKGGIKCLHARCAGVGPRDFAGFWTNVDVVAKRDGVAARAAAEQICEWFGLKCTPHAAASNGATTATIEWNRPLRLNEHQGAVPFPVQALGASVRDWVEAEASATQTPSDLAAVVALATLSACVSKKFEVEVRPGWREPLNTYWLVALEPGNRKSTVFRDAVRPIHDFEQHLAEKLRDRVQAASVAREIKQRELKRAIDRAARSALPTDRQQAAELAIEFDREQVPVVPRLVVDDVTPERLAAMLAEHGGRLALLSAEGGLFEVAGGRYSDGVPNLDVLLKSHPGDDLRVDRVGRGPVHVRHPALTLGVAVQPEVIRELARKAVFRGSGLLARFFYSLPESTVGRRDARPPSMPESVSDRYRQLCTAPQGQDAARLGRARSRRVCDWRRRLRLSVEQGVWSRRQVDRNEDWN